MFIPFARAGSPLLSRGKRELTTIPAPIPTYSAIVFADAPNEILAFPSEEAAISFAENVLGPAGSDDPTPRFLVEPANRVPQLGANKKLVLGP